MNAIAAVTPFLPDGAFDHSSLTRALKELVRAWSDKWFASAPALCRALSAAPAPTNRSSADWRSLGDVAALDQQSGADMVLVGAMVGIAIDPASLLPSDRMIVDSLADACLDDLLYQVANLCGHVEGGAVRSAEILPRTLKCRRLWEISWEAGAPSLILGLPEASLIELLKRQMGSSPKIALKPLNRGLATQQARLDVDLGCCALTLGDVEELGVGDVLILDRSAAAPVDVLVAGSRSHLTGKLDQAGNRSRLTLSKPTSN